MWKVPETESAISEPFHRGIRDRIELVQLIAVPLPPGRKTALATDTSFSELIRASNILPIFANDRPSSPTKRAISMMSSAFARV